MKFTSVDLISVFFTLKINGDLHRREQKHQQGHQEVTFPPCMLTPHPPLFTTTNVPSGHALWGHQTPPCPKPPKHNLKELKQT